MVRSVALARATTVARLFRCAIMALLFAGAGGGPSLACDDARDYILYFVPGAARPAPAFASDYERTLADFAKVVTSTRPIVQISVWGHASARSPKEAMRLSRRRAEMVRDRLVALGAPRMLMKVEPRGDERPVAAAPKGRTEPLNERVELSYLELYYHCGRPFPPPPPPLDLDFVPGLYKTR
jgi:hypothetical protein